MCRAEQYLQMVWNDDQYEMSFDDLLAAIKTNGFKYVGATSKRLILEKVK